MEEKDFLMLDEETKNDIPSGFVLRNILQDSRKIINRIAWSPDGRMLASAHRDKIIQLWDIDTNSVKYTLDNSRIENARVETIPPNPVAARQARRETFAPDEPLRRTHKLSHSQETLDDDTSLGSFNYSVAWSPDGRMLASGGKFSLFLWDAATGELHTKLKTATESNKCLAWSSDGTTLAFGSDDGFIRLWDLISRKVRLLLQGHNCNINSIAWSPKGGTLASGSKDGMICFWNPDMERPIWAFTECSSAVNSVVWSPDGGTLASASSDTTIRIWDFEDRQLSVIIEGHIGPIVCIAFSCDGQLLASKSLDGTVRLWRPDTGKMLATINEPALSYGWYAGLAFHPDAPCLATLGEKDTIIRIWDLDIDSILGSTSIESTIQYRSAKVILVGEEHVGKTSLSLVLTNHPYVPPESTHGRRVRLFNSREVNLGNGLKETRETLLWDLAGQQHYRLIHQLHLNEVALALIVFNGHSDTDPFEQINYWERMLRLVQHTVNEHSSLMKRFLVAARMDRGGRSTMQSRIDKIMSNLKLDEYFVTSAKEGTGIVELAGAIETAINWEVLPKVSSIKLFQSVKDFVVAWKERGSELPFIDDLYRAFLISQPKMADNEELRAQFETCMDQMESQGLVKKLSFGTFVLLKPELLDYYASALVDAVLGEEDGLGNILEEKVQEGNFYILPDNRLKNKELEKILLIAMIAYLQRHEIVLRESSDDGSYLVFPSLATRELSDSIDIGKRTVVFRFEGPVLNIYATLAVRLSHSNLFKKQKTGKDAMTFTYSYGDSEKKSGTCGIFLQNIGEGIGELTLSFDKHENSETHLLHSQFEQAIYAHLQSRALPESIKRERIFTCSGCGEPFLELIVKHRRERGFSTIRCGFCETVVSIDEDSEKLLSADQSTVSNIDFAANDQRDHEISITTLYGISQTKIMREEYDVFLCYNHDDKVSVRKIRKQLRARGLAPWFDKSDLRPGFPWHRQLEHQIKNIKSAAVFVGKTGIGPWQRLEVEALLREFVRRDCPVIPVILSNAPSEPELPIFLEGMNWVDFRKALPELYQPLEYYPPRKDSLSEHLLLELGKENDQNDNQNSFELEDPDPYQDQDPMDLLVWGITGKRVVTND